MKTWDLTAGAGKLELGWESLRVAGVEVKKSWNDEARRKFHETYVASLEPKVRGMLDAIQRLSEVLATAERQCGME